MARLQYARSLVLFWVILAGGLVNTVDAATLETVSTATLQTSELSPHSEGLLITQVIPDDTLGAENSLISPNEIIQDGPAILIEGGANRGPNLFHSFTEFNVNAGQRVYFDNPEGIANILSRVTGRSFSNIDGLLGVDGEANLFLLNPNGIIFGPDAQLDIRGSFTASTAESFTFADGGEFSATNPQGEVLLSVSVPLGIQLNDLPQNDITNDGELAVAPGQNLTLFGNTVLSSSNLTASGGTVRVLGNQVGLIGQAQIDVSSTTGGGTVLVGGDYQGQGDFPTATQTYIDSAVVINADALVDGDGGRVIIWADDDTSFYGDVSAQGGIQSGDGGFIEVSGERNLLFHGDVNTASNGGVSGTLLLDPANIVIANGNGDEAGDGDNAFQGNNSGIVGSVLSIPLSSVNDTVPTVLYESELENLSGDTNIILQATNDITLNNLIDDELNFSTGEGFITLIADADNDGAGNFTMQDAGDTLDTNGRIIKIEGNNLSIGNLRTFDPFSGDGSPVSLKATGNITLNGTINTSGVFAQLGTLGRGGEVSLVANGDITIASGGSIRSRGLPGGNIALNSNANVSSFDGEIRNDLLSDQSQNQAFKGGDINIGAESIYLINSEIRTTNFGGGNAGNLVINARDIALFDNSFASSQVGFGAVGNGGNIEIFARVLEVINDSGISTSTSGIGHAGNLTVKAKENILLDGNGSPRTAISNSLSSGVFANAVGNAGNVEIEVSNGSLHAARSSISTSTLGQGNAGDLTIRAYDDVTFESSLLGSGISDPGVLGPDAQGSSGDVTIIATNGSISMTENTSISSQTFGQGDAGDIRLESNDVTYIEGSRISNNTVNEAVGDAGTIRITTGSLFLFNNPQSSGPTSLSSSTSALGNSGDIIIGARDVVVFDGGNAFTQVSSEAIGDAGDIEITARSFEVVGSFDVRNASAVLSTSTFGKGSAGNVTITVDEDVSFENSTIFSDVNPEAIGDGGDIEITANTGSISVTNGAQLLTRTNGQGDAGPVTLKAGERISLDGFFTTVSSEVGFLGEGKGGDIEITTPLISVSNGAQLNSRATGQGNAGDIEVNSASIDLINQGRVIAESISTSGGDINLRGLNTLFLTDGAVSASTQNGRAGSITINEDNGDLQTPNIPVELVRLEDNARISVEAISGGDAGSITVNAERLQLTNSSINVSSPEGEAGNLSIRAISTANDGFQLDNSELTSVTGAGTLGPDDVRGIIITAADPVIQLRGGSLISAQALGVADGGNLTFNAGDSFIIASIDGNNDIIATAEGGTGGDITINALRLFEFVERNEPNTNNQFRQNETNDISASSEAGLPGNVNLLTLDIDPNRGLTELPTLSPSPPIQRGCSIDALGTSSFTVTGRGGLPANPTDILNRNHPLTDLGPNDTSFNAFNPPQINDPPETTSAPLIEAQTLVKNSDGRTFFVSTATSDVSWPQSIHCTGRVANH